MSDPKQEHYRRCVSYLVKTLQRNPLDEAAVIVAGRNRLLGFKNEVPSRGAPIEEQRQKRGAILSEIEKVRSNFWSAPLSELQSALAKIVADDFPDLRATVDRLKTVATHRSQFPALVNHRHFDSSLFSVLKEVLVAPPKEVAVKKERVLASFAKGSSRRRGKKMIKLLQSELPDIYRLEASWLNSLVRQKRAPLFQIQPASHATTSTTTSGGSVIPWWAIIGVAIVILRAILRASGN